MRVSNRMKTVKFNKVCFFFFFFFFKEIPGSSKKEKVSATLLL